MDVNPVLSQVWLSLALGSLCSGSRTEGTGMHWAPLHCGEGTVWVGVTDWWAGAGGPQSLPDQTLVGLP